MSAGHKYHYYIFSGVSGLCCTLPFSGLSLFFDGNSVNAGVSVYGPLGTSQFLADASSILSLAGKAVVGGGRTLLRNGVEVGPRHERHRVRIGVRGDDHGEPGHLRNRVPQSAELGPRQAAERGPKFPSDGPGPPA